MQGVFLTCGLNKQLAYTLRAGLWLGIWFALTARPRAWAEEAEAWKGAAGREVWKPTFIKVHALMWRLLLVFLLYTVVGLLAAAAGKALSLQFHHQNHFARMQVCSVNSDQLIQLCCVFCKPCSCVT
jgi:hypothetical protein